MQILLQEQILPFIGALLLGFGLEFLWMGLGAAVAVDDFDFFIAGLGRWPLLTEFSLVESSRFDWSLQPASAGDFLGLVSTRSIIRTTEFEIVGSGLTLSRSMSSISDSDSYSNDDMYSSGGSFGVQLISFHSSNRIWRTSQIISPLTTSSLSDRLLDANWVSSPHCGEGSKIAEESLFVRVVARVELRLGTFEIRRGNELALFDGPVWSLGRKLIFD